MKEDIGQVREREIDSFSSVTVNRALPIIIAVIPPGNAVPGPDLCQDYAVYKTPGPEILDKLEND